jgi:hypothetical protein
MHGTISPAAIAQGSQETDVVEHNAADVACPTSVAAELLLLLLLETRIVVGPAFQACKKRSTRGW